MKLITKISGALFLLLAYSPQAGAVTALKKLQVTDNAQLDLLFDGKIQKGQIKTEFFNDIIQLSLSDVSVYPAKIFSVQGMDLTKVFAYQYAPKLVRTRLSVKGKAEDYKDRIQVKIEGKVVTIRLTEAADRVQSHAAQAARAQQGSSDSASAAVNLKSAEKPAASAANHEPARATTTDEIKVQTAPGRMSDDEKILLEKVIKSGESKSASREMGRDRENERPLSIGGGKPGPSLAKTFGMLILTLGAFGALALLLKRVRAGGGSDPRRLSGLVGKFVRAGLGQKEKMIDVVATHYLGPKKSIAVVRVGTKLMVLGITNEAINLIAQLPDRGTGTLEGGANAEAAIAEQMGNLDLEDFIMGVDRKSAPETFTAKVAKAAAGAASVRQGAGATSGGGPSFGGYGASASVAGKPVFSDLLTAERAKPSVRDQIKSRVEGMKQL